MTPGVFVTEMSRGHSLKSSIAGVCLDLLDLNQQVRASLLSILLGSLATTASKI